MTTVLDTRTGLWSELTRLVGSVRDHVDRHPTLWIGSVDVFATEVGAGRAEVYVSGQRARACARLLEWRDSLKRASLCLEVEDNPMQPRALVFGQLHDSTTAMVAAPLAEEDVRGVSRDRTGEWVLHWLRMQAVS
ncbi:hypothetical protein [Actinokineospora globicatena]|uniref:hypothetical protein n=1 Tax=Actinokineospora globicatena TaxID=103729 RepID=UPI0020A25FDA|nr:hypothetical protein [Actinokineospora globicatena]MCP2302448.1 hypothetical protein [Actinokineospora globicatena]GLW75869.1 hypothetical protein Aglo01_03510 [Actinokineospora globicatena]GLW82707.1 hypothetical protein Aglo02_03480 [Actinokineospora globicatena]